MRVFHDLQRYEIFRQRNEEQVLRPLRLLLRFGLQFLGLLKGYQDCICLIKARNLNLRFLFRYLRKHGINQRLKV